MDPSLDVMSPGAIQLVGTLSPHAFDGKNQLQPLLWITPESNVAHALSSRYLTDSGCATLPARLTERLPIGELLQAKVERWSGAQLRPVLIKLFDGLTESTPRPAQVIHPSVKKAARLIHALPEKTISADELAHQVGISKSRLLHLLKEHLGIPLRAYLQWLRCIDGIVLMKKGRSATQAAIEAGFTEGAHFNRVMRRLTSISPSNSW